MEAPSRELALATLERTDAPVPQRLEAAYRLIDLAAELHAPLVELAVGVGTLVGDKDPELRCAGLELAAVTMGPVEAQAIFAAALRDPLDEIRLEAAGRIADLGRPEARGLLAGALQDNTFQVRFEAARGMAALHHGAGREILEEALSQSDLRFRALGALAELCDVASAPAIRRVFEKWLLPAFDRTQAAGALARMGDEPAMQHLLKRATTKKAADRPLALEMCGEVKVPGAFELLRQALKDPWDACRGAAARALGRLKDPRALPLLREQMADISLPPDLRLDAAEGLLLNGDPEAVASVQASLDAFSGEPREELLGMMEGFEAERAKP